MIGKIVFWILWPAQAVYFPFTQRTRVLAACGDEVLVVRQWVGNGRWGLPGGGVRRHETYAQSAARELYEETGLQVDSPQLTPLKTAWYRGQGLRLRCHYFTVTLPHKAQPHPRHEIREACWLPRAQLSSRTANPDVVAAIAG